ncbi:nuclear transport factor 2 family protein [Sodalis sp. RH23]|uniref:nuclear transport factor 2 family protein n=1 Tax=unclassified Sodalis (in: enterobacteria) TaxID=2636512 RepID=UPI0039B4D518
MVDRNRLTLEQRLQITEDKLAIYELIASHPPSADSGLAEYTASVYMEDGVFNRGEGLDGAKGVNAIAAFILRPAHEKAIKSGLAHFAGLPLIDLRGDTAIVTSYLQLLQLDQQGEPREMANHGYSTGYRIHRVVVNRWELERHDNRWKIRSRTLLPVDGTDAPRQLLARGLSDILKSTRQNS